MGRGRIAPPDRRQAGARVRRRHLREHQPGTGKVVGVAPDVSLDDIELAMAAARRAFDETDWSTDVEFRVRCIRQLQAAFQEHADEIRELTVAEVGCPVSLTYGAQLDVPVGGLGFAADTAEGYAWETDMGEAAPFGMKSTPHHPP